MAGWGGDLVGLLGLQGRWRVVIVVLVACRGSRAREAAASAACGAQGDGLRCPPAASRAPRPVPNRVKMNQAPPAEGGTPLTYPVLTATPIWVMSQFHPIPAYPQPCMGLSAPPPPPLVPLWDLYAYMVGNHSTDPFSVFDERSNGRTPPKPAGRQVFDKCSTNGNLLSENFH